MVCVCRISLFRLKSETVVAVLWWLVFQLVSWFCVDFLMVFLLAYFCVAILINFFLIGGGFVFYSFSNLFNNVFLQFLETYILFNNNYLALFCCGIILQTLLFAEPKKPTYKQQFEFYEAQNFANISLCEILCYCFGY